MPKEKGFGELVKDAQKETGGWSTARRAAVQLEGQSRQTRVVSSAPDSTQRNISASRAGSDNKK